MLSKMAKPEPKTNYKEISKIDLSTLKLPELKKYAKDLNIKISGNKFEIKTRIENQINLITSAIKIQKIFRRHLVLEWIKLKGTKENCVNDTDFYTLEPLNEIPYLYFIKYVDVSHNVNYGFDIKSLCTLATKNKKFENPYNRENLKTTFGTKMVKVVKITNILFPGNDLMMDIANVYESSSHTVATESFSTFFQNLNQLTLDQRITNLFIHIDSLGNYTNKEWLTQLNEERRYYLVVKINQLWNKISSVLRQQICPHISPFSTGFFGISPTIINTEMVVKMAEILVYSGIDNEHKKLGAMYFLSGLTLVSVNARNQIPWLYENYFTIVR
jgi:hypothetical protein